MLWRTDPKYKWLGGESVLFDVTGQRGMLEWLQGPVLYSDEEVSGRQGALGAAYRYVNHVLRKLA